MIISDQYFDRLSPKKVVRNLDYKKMNQIFEIILTKEERNRIIYARYTEGYSQEEIGRFYELSQSQVSNIILKKERGIVSPTEETRGSKSRLSESDLKKLAELLESPTKDEQDFSYWNKWRVKELIKETFEVDYHENYIWKLMKKIGFSSQRPQKKDYRQSPEKVERFKNEGVANIKKVK